MPAVPLIVRGGQTVPPREVEQVLLGHPAVAEAVVVGVPDRFWGEVVGAAVRLSAPLPSAAIVAATAAALTRTCKKPRCACDMRAKARADTNTASSLLLPIAGTRIVLIIRSPLAGRDRVGLSRSRHTANAADRH